jgi:ABC-2 type transport system permease protein
MKTVPSMGAVPRLFAAQLRRDRWQLLIWAAGMGLMVVAATTAVTDEFTTTADRRALVALAASNPAILFLRGVPDGIGFGSLIYFQLFAFLALFAGLMSTFLVVRHTRGDEELGRTELLGGTRAPRTAPLLATALLAVLANLLVGAAVAVALLLVGLEFGGALLTGSALAAAGACFAGVATVTAQLMPTARAANGAAAAIVGAGYLVRGIGDAFAVPDQQLSTAESAWISWASPIGWGQKVEPFTDANTWPLLLALAATLVLFVVGARIRATRDLGSSIVPERRGSARAGVQRRSLAGIAWTLAWPAMIGWAIGAAVLGTLAGALAPTIADALADNAALNDLLRRLSPTARGGAVDVFASALLGIAGILAAAAGVQAALRLRSEEAEGRAELLLSAPVRKSAWLLSHLATAVLSVAAVALAAGLATGAAFAATGDGGRVASSLEAALAHVPAALVFVGLVALVFALLPRFAVPIGWGLLGVGIAVGQFGELLRLPDQVKGLSPFAHSPGLPADEADLLPLIGMTAIAVAGAWAATIGFRLRDVQS